MELHPILDPDTCPNPQLWYVLSAMGECPSVRVGHTCTYIPGSDGSNGNVYVVGGANPSGPFAETFVLDLDTMSWDTVDVPGLKPRYEHSAFSPVSQPTKVYVFGGADQAGNHNDIQVFDAVANTWTTVTPGGTPPANRTYHTTASCGDKFIVYSGGHCGSDPVGDRQVHCFDANTLSWSVLNVRGDSPKPRHGHVVVAVGNKIYIHGGMSGTTFYDDLHVLNLETNSWSNIKQKRGHPCARAAHSGCSIGTDLYICGGMNKNGALDDIFKLDTLTNKWTTIPLDGPPPSSRLDFGMCPIRLKVPDIPPENPGNMMASRSQARDVLESQLRLGSAGSVRSASSLGSAGSQRSVASAGSHRDAASAGSQREAADARTSSSIEASTNSSPQHLPKSPASEDPPEAEPSTPNDALETAASANGETVTYKTVDMCLILGGMDTEGEIFDDCLVMLVQ